MSDERRIEHTAGQDGVEAGNFRRSMAGLHRWAGLLAGWLLFFVFLTGTLGYLNDEIDHWMRPEQPPARTVDAHQIAQAQHWLRANASGAAYWSIALPNDRGNPGLELFWHDSATGERKRQMLDQQTGQPFTDAVRETGGGQTLYMMHYALHYLPLQWAYYLVGAATMFMLTAILSGIVTHRRIFVDFFTLRFGKGQRSWLDAHNLLSVAALPYHLMITWSGLVFFLFLYMPLPLGLLYPDEKSQAAFQQAAYGTSPQVQALPTRSAPLASLATSYQQAERDWGKDTVAFIDIDHPGTDAAQVSVHAASSGLDRARRSLGFDGVSGERLPGDDHPTATGRFASVLLGLHEARFSGPLLRGLFVLSGLAGTAMIATGLILWATKRRPRSAKVGEVHFGARVVDVLNLGTIIGLPIGIAAYFWTNRLLPVGMADRAAWEVHMMFLAWGITYIYAIWRPLQRGWIELVTFAAAAYCLIPLLNAVTTDRGLIPALREGDWIMAGFDISAVATGLALLFVAHALRHHGDRRRNDFARAAVT